MRRVVLIVSACLLASSLPVAAHPAFDAAQVQAASIPTPEHVRPAMLFLDPAPWLEGEGSAGFPADYSDDAYSREEERLRDGE